MKKIVAVCLVAAAFTAAVATADEVLSIGTIKVAGHDVSLLRIKKADGYVCQDYISQSSREQGGEGEVVTVKIGQVCDIPVRIESPTDGLSKNEVYPLKLEAMRWVQTADGLGIHALSLSNK